MAVLAKEALVREMKRADDPLVITPLLDTAQIGDASIDLRLGHQFIVLLRSSVDHIDPAVAEGIAWETALHRSQQRIRMALFQSFVLHPGQLVLAATLEYISVPRNLAAVIEGRSSWGRLGLIVATANSVSPGFKGCITLELVNQGGVPLKVYPGLPIAQMVFHRAEGASSYQGRYNCPTGPEFSRIHGNEALRWSGPKTSE